MLQVSCLIGLLLGLATSAAASDVILRPPWDGIESIDRYASRLNLPASDSIQLSPTVSIPLRLIPAAGFTMGVKEPVPPIPSMIPPQAILIVGLTIAAVLLAEIAVTSRRRRIRPQFSLRRLILLSLALAISTGGAVNWHRAKNALLAYQQDQDRFRSAQDNEKPARTVTISKPYYMGECTVTQEQYQEIMNASPSLFKGPQRPVENVTWNQAMEFCNRLSAKTGRKVRLSTEAEWEFAAKAGGNGRYGAGDSEAELAQSAWYNATSYKATQDVGKKAPNAFGLYDMFGNVFQWCADHGQVPYAELPAIDPVGNSTKFRDFGNMCAMRGGSWYSAPLECRVTNRACAEPDMALEFIGFRIVVEVDENSK